ncbi:hypothetical protein GCM10009828_084440 [Actinoplanes couchii]|uniref:Uncharacterized protein n=2 Tax=Actinoplanes couchii TaxID=403638 RepID=A0ABQ3XNQ0_9ACTN|nr:hypothetical protein Aco03nite_084990 [Actinoplanes couchii]
MVTVGSECFGEWTMRTAIRRQLTRRHAIRMLGASMIALSIGSAASRKAAEAARERRIEWHQPDWRWLTM